MDKTEAIKSVTLVSDETFMPQTVYEEDSCWRHTIFLSPKVKIESSLITVLPEKFFSVWPQKGNSF